MRISFKYTALLMMGFILLTVSAVSAQDGKGRKIVFPEVEGWKKGNVTMYPTAELGYSIPYQSVEGGTVTVYVYNGGQRSIADGTTDPKVKNEIKRAENDIRAAGDAGNYENVKFIKNDTVTLGDLRSALYSLFSFSLNGRAVDSEIYLFGYQNNFIKIRATRSKGANGPKNAALDDLLRAVATIFQ